MTSDGSWIVERGPIAAPEYLRETPNDGDHWHAWVPEYERATRWSDESSAMHAAMETGADALRITEVEEDE